MDNPWNFVNGWRAIADFLALKRNPALLLVALLRRKGCGRH